MKNYPESAARRAMKVTEVILKALAREIKWIQAADILGVTPRTIRRMRAAYQEQGVGGLLDRRRGQPSVRRVPCEMVEKVLCLYVTEYFDFNLKHGHEQLVEKHGIPYSYTWLKNLLQEAGYVKRGKGRGGHRKRRERRALLGQMLHLDGSDHEWLALVPGERQVLLLVVDDATGKNLAAWLVEAETTKTCMGIMRAVVETYGVPVQLYTDRHSVYWYTAKAGGKVDRERLTQFGLALEELGVEMIPGYSPQARGRSERWNGTWQGRLVAELRQAGIDNLAAANRYIAEVFLPEMNRKFAQEAAEPGDAFVGTHGADLDRIFAIRHEDRVVANDNTVRVNNLTLQIEKSPFRQHFAKCRVDVLEHLDDTYTVVWQKRVIGRYDSQGQALGINPGGQPPDPRSLSPLGPEKRLKEKRRKASLRLFSGRLPGARVALQRGPILPRDTRII
jgi:transposase